MNDDKFQLDPVHASDRIKGSTSPESGPESSNVVGRPIIEDTATQFHEPSETAGKDRDAFDDEAALSKGGSFDGLGLPVAEK